MIYQCYFRPEQQARLFDRDPYRGFGLEPNVNATLLERCPELGEESTRTALAEYGALLHIWRNLPFDADNWIGFTSYRQLDKSDFLFESGAQVEALLAGHDFLAWNVWSVAHVRCGPLTGAAAQAEISHPLLHGFTVDVFRDCGIGLPMAYLYAAEVPFANYWVMGKDAFAAFMAWSWPLVRRALTIEHPYKRYNGSWNEHDDKRKAVGYFMERLFVIWTMLKPQYGRRLGAVRRA